MITYLIVYLIPYNGSLIRKKKNKIKYGLFEKIDVEIFENSFAVITSTDNIDIVLVV